MSISRRSQGLGAGPNFMMRSKLFVPASRPELFAKAQSSAADSLSFDLEDAVAPARKDEARTLLTEHLRNRDAGGKTIVVRVNAVGTPVVRGGWETRRGGRRLHQQSAEGETPRRCQSLGAIDRKARSGARRRPGPGQYRNPHGPAPRG